MALLRKLNKTYQKVFRDRHIRARKLSLTDSEYRLWDLCVAVYDWDKKHTQTFGTLETTDRELASILGWSASKACRKRNSLIRKGLIEKTEIGTYKVVPVGAETALLHQGVAQTQQEIAPTQEKGADLQQKQTQTADSSLVSYKDKYRLVRSDREYNRLSKDYSFSTEELKWIDQNA